MDDIVNDFERMVSVIISPLHFQGRLSMLMSLPSVSAL